MKKYHSLFSAVVALLSVFVVCGCDKDKQNCPEGISVPITWTLMESGEKWKDLKKEFTVPANGETLTFEGDINFGINLIRVDGETDYHYYDYMDYIEIPTFVRIERPDRKTIKFEFYNNATGKEKCLYVIIPNNNQYNHWTFNQSATK